MKVLWLPSWYPSKIKPYNGDFIQRHAQAASLYHDIEVIFVEKDVNAVVTQNISVDEKTTGRLREKIIHFHVHSRNKFLNSVSSFRRYRSLYKRAIVKHIEEHGKPDLVHVHVAMKAGILAQWMKRRYGIPYVITEHWTGYIPSAEENLFRFPLYWRSVNKRLLQGARALSVVSEYLGRCINELVNVDQFTVIPNVVNTDLFTPALKNKGDELNFIHISTLGYQKNPEAIIRAFAIFLKQTSNFSLRIVGPESPQLEKLVLDLGLKDNVQFSKEVPQLELVKHIQAADALILYSRYETFGCVIIEANACGLPVIVSDIDPFEEIVHENFNGIKVKPNSPEQLAQSFIWFMKNKNNFNRDSIVSHTAAKYSYDVVGKQFANWYQTILKQTE